MGQELYSNTTLVKVKLGNGKTQYLSKERIQIQHLLKLNNRTEVEAYMVA